MPYQVLDDNPLISIIIRTKNESVWLPFCLDAIFSQSVQNLEVILVDNGSSDRTLEIAAQYNVKVLESDGEFLPGLNINQGIRVSSGKFIVCISGHCVPVNSNWLENLIKEFTEEDIAGVYGRQLPLSYSTDNDKRDLLTVFGLDRKTQTKDPFFHNANSAIRRDAWELLPFDETVTNVEDRIWGKNILAKGYKLVYTPDAQVFHWHGINHDGNSERAAKVVSVLENQSVYDTYPYDSAINNELIVALPIRKKDLVNIGNEVLTELIENIELNLPQCKIALICDDNSIAYDFCNNLNRIPIIRNGVLNSDFMDVLEILRILEPEIIKSVGNYDSVLFLNCFFPNRSWDDLHLMRDKLINQKLDAVIAVKENNHGLWKLSLVETNYAEKNSGKFFELIRNSPSRVVEDKIYNSILGYGSLFSKKFIRHRGDILQDTTLYPIVSNISSLEIRSLEDWLMLKNFPIVESNGFGGK